MQLDTNFLRHLTSISSPSGGEEKLARAFVQYLEEAGCSGDIDSLYNAICSNNGTEGPRIMLEAHSDEIGMQVVHVSEDGYIYFRRNGAVDGATLQGAEVVIAAREGDVEGVIGKKPIHLCGEGADKVPPVEDMWIDIGAADGDDARRKVEVGDLITFKHNFREEGSKIISKGLDDKIGVFVVAEAMKRLAKENIKAQLYACASAQEEVGCRGCRVAAGRIKPDIAICVDVGFATDFPGMPENKYGRMKLGNGVVLNSNCDNNPELVKIAKETASKHNIKYQNYTFPVASGGTDTANIQLTDMGVRTLLLSIPCRYMHTPVEICDLADVTAAIELICEIVKQISVKL